MIVDQILEFFDLEGVDVPSLVLVHATLSCAVFVYAAQCARPLALDVRRWLRARG